MRKNLLLLLSLAACTVLQAQNRSGNQVLYSTPEGSLRIQVCNERMVRVTKSTTMDFVKDEPWMVIRYTFDPVDFRADAQGIETAAMRLAIDPGTWLVRVSDKDGRILYQETAS